MIHLRIEFIQQAKLLEMISRSANSIIDLFVSCRNLDNPPSQSRTMIFSYFDKFAPLIVWNRNQFGEICRKNSDRTSFMIHFTKQLGDLSFSDFVNEREELIAGVQMELRM